MSTQVADFVWFRDKSFELPNADEGIDMTFKCNIPDIPVTGEVSVLSWNHLQNANGSVHYDVKVNGKLITAVGYDVDSAQWSTVQEILRANDEHIVIHQGENKVEFRVLSGTGLGIADVVLLFRKYI